MKSESITNDNVTHLELGGHLGIVDVEGPEAQVVRELDDGVGADKHGKVAVVAVAAAELAAVCPEENISRASDMRRDIGESTE